MKKLDAAQVSEAVVQMHNTPRFRRMMADPTYRVGIDDIFSDLNPIRAFRDARTMRRARKIMDQLTPQAKNLVLADSMAREGM